MTTQFIRLNCYGEWAGARRKPHENAYDILDEAARVPGSASHVRKPRPPVQLYGLPLESIRDRVVGFSRIARDHRGARLRRDGTVLYAIVASYPIAWRKLDGENALALYNQWRQAVVDWLKGKFGDRLQAIVEHVDEGQPHIHAFVIPPLCPRHRIDHRLHPGLAARAAALGNGGDRLAGERAYRNGMRSWQDDFHQMVSQRFGHGRIGPRRKRFRRDVALVRQASDRFLERTETIMAHLAQRLDAMPALATPEERAEIDAIAEVFRAARSRLRDGRADALEGLETALVDRGETGKASSAAGDENSELNDGFDPHPHWEGDDDLRPDDMDDNDIDHDDDPDPEAPDHCDFDDNWEADPDDGFDVEPPDFLDDANAS